MAGWIKFDKDLRDDPRFLRMVRAFKSSGNALVTHERMAVTLLLGGLVTLWCYADSYIRNDDTLDLGAHEIDQLVGIENFASLLPSDWLQVLDSEHVKLPDFQAHNGVSARKKAQTAMRVAAWRKRQIPKHGNAPALQCNEVTSKDLDRDQTSVTSNDVTKNNIELTTQDAGALFARPRKQTTTVPRGTRCPEPFEITPAMRAWAAEECPAFDLEGATREFVDYWRGVPGQRGRKLDWPATWRNRMREISARRTGRINGAPKLPASDPTAAPNWLTDEERAEYARQHGGSHAAQ